MLEGVSHPQGNRRLSPSHTANHLKNNKKNQSSNSEAECGEFEHFTIHQ